MTDETLSLLIKEGSNNHPQHCRRPLVTPYTQQELPSIQFYPTVWGYISIFLLLGAIFLPSGLYFNDMAQSITEFKIPYDGEGIKSDCTIDRGNVGRKCTLTLHINQTIKGPLFLYYELDGFYQNHHRYLKSRSNRQLWGEKLDAGDVRFECYPVLRNGSQLLSPCGLYANTFFNDVIDLRTEEGKYSMDTENIAYYSDTSGIKFNQPKGFVYGEIKSRFQTCADVLGPGYSNCKSYDDENSGRRYFYYYPDDDKVQYLYETYPEIVSPIEGVTNRHFINWMRPAGLPTFRKLYGIIHSRHFVLPRTPTISPNNGKTGPTNQVQQRVLEKDYFHRGDKLTFQITANYEVQSINTKKSLIVTNLNYFYSTKDNNYILGYIYVVIGILSTVIGLFIGVVNIFIEIMLF